MFVRLLPCLLFFVSACVLMHPGFCGADVRSVSGSAFLERTLESHSGDIMSRRFRLGSATVNLGGFLVAEGVRAEGESSELAVDNLNFLSWIEATPKLRLFSEIELNKLVLVTDDGRSIASDPGIDVNRLFGEFDVNDQLRIRVGKFLTPVGRWNPVLADPFVWTTSEPLVAELAFDDTTTGAMLGGTLFLSSGALRYSVYGQFVDPSKPDPEPPPADRTVGTRLEFLRLLQGWSVGTSFLAVERDRLWHYLGGMDALWQRGPFELMFESVVEDGELDERRLWGGYLQGVYEWRRGLHVVTRLEHFDRNGEPAVGAFDLGFAWFPVANVLLKADYLLVSRRTDDVSPGLRASFSFLF